MALPNTILEGIILVKALLYMNAFHTNPMSVHLQKKCEKKHLFQTRNERVTYDTPLIANLSEVFARMRTPHKEGSTLIRIATTEHLLRVGSQAKANTSIVVIDHPGVMLAPPTNKNRCRCTNAAFMFHSSK